MTFQDLDRPQQSVHIAECNRGSAYVIADSQACGADQSKEYADAIIKHAERSYEASLGSGVNYRALANFLQPVSKGTPSRAAIRALKQQGNYPYVTIHHFDRGVDNDNANSPTEYGAVAGVEKVLDLPQPQPQSCRIIFARGLPSPEWTAVLGSKNSLDPEYFRRHLDFEKSKDYYDLPPLPSTSTNILRLRVTTICSSSAALSWQDVEDSRNADQDFVFAHHTSLGADGQIGDSIIRRIAIHNERAFTIEQDISVCVRSKKEGGWTGVVMLDSGRDLDQGIWPMPSKGQGLTRKPTNEYIPVLQHRPKLALLSSKFSTSSSAKSSTMKSSLKTQDYGRSLDSRLVRVDALYAFSELFKFAASSENQFLTFMRQQINDSMRTFQRHEAISLANLRYSNQLLKEHIEHNQEILSFLHGRRDNRWPQATGGADKQRAMESLKDLQRDYQHLLRRCKTLCSNCSEGMSSIVGSSALQEYRRSLRQAQFTERLTVLAFLFLPLSTVSSIFGMNVVQLGQGSLSIWVPFVVLAPLWTASLFYCFRRDIYSAAREVKAWFS